MDRTFPSHLKSRTPRNFCSKRRAGFEISIPMSCCLGQKLGKFISFDFTEKSRVNSGEINKLREREDFHSFILSQ